jgi:acyl carrier protein
MMTLQTKILDFLTNLAADMRDLDATTLGPESTIDELGLDSMDITELTVEIKRNYRVDLTPEKLPNQLQTSLGEIADVIGWELNRANAA